MTAPLRVTQVVFDLDGGGLETIVAQMARRWAGKGVITSVITLSGRVGRVGATLETIVDQFHVLRPLPIASMVLPIGLARAIRNTRPDVVHLHSGAWFKSALAAKLARAPRVVYTEHGREHYDPPLLRGLDRLASRWTDVVVPVSDRLGRYLAAVVGVEPQHLHTIPNAVDTECYTPGPPSPEVLRALGLPPGALVVGSLGRLERVKRYDRLLHALARLPAAIGGRPVYLLLCGEGSERQGLEALAARLGVAARVRLPGWLEDAPGAHRLLDVFALTSDSEGMSVSLLEAMASGTAPVVMDVGANAELFGPDLAGQVVPPGDVDALVAALLLTLSDAPQRDRVGRLARERVCRKHELSVMLAAYERVYRGTEPARRPA